MAADCPYRGPGRANRAPGLKNRGAQYRTTGLPHATTRYFFHRAGRAFAALAAGACPGRVMTGEKMPAGLLHAGVAERALDEHRLSPPLIAP